MVIADWSEFIGAYLQPDPKRLPPGIGVSAQNMRIGFADLRGWGSNDVVVTTGGATPLISAYRMGRTTISDTASWIQWTTDVDVARSLIPTDTTEEIYFTGAGAPQLTDNVIGLPAAPGPASTRTLGIPAPASAMATPTVAVAGAATNETRVYVDTFVNDKGRESAPGIGVTVVVAGGSTMDITGLAAVPSGNHGINLRRIYCSTDGGDYLQIVEQLATLTTSSDTLARGNVLQSGGDTSKPAWLVPPSTMIGIISLWNGMLGGFSGKSYMVCEPGKPWAWPVEYQDALPDDIVGTGKWSQNWVALTTACPYILNGAGPLNIGYTPVAFQEACVSKRSVVSMPGGVAWASQHGLCFIGDSGPVLVTDGIISTEQWEAMVPSTIVGSHYHRYYVGFYNDGTSKGFLIDPLNPQGGIIFLSQGAQGVFFDTLSGRLYIQDTGNVIRRWNKGATQQAVTFKTGVKRTPYLTNPGYGLLVANEPVSVALTLWANVLQPNGTFVWTSVFTKTVTSGQPFTLPGGYSAQEFQAQFVTTGPLQGFLLVEDASDLA